MAKGQVKKTLVSENQMVFALDIGTRSIIGMVGVMEEGKVKIVAIEKEEHSERAMIDGQIENIEKVAMLADRVKKRLESKLDVTLTRVCVAAAGRALRTRRADFELELSGAQMIDDEIISRLEAGAISKAEEAFDAENEAEGDMRRYYLVGYTVCQYYLDQYMMSSLKDHRGRQVKVDLIATFLPSEVVESLYTTMNKIGLEVASLTLEPIAAINAAIPENLRLLNLVMVDIGAGTSDIAACTDGSVTGYTMATVAGDEVTEALMKAFLVDFGTAEMIKARIDQDEVIGFSDILGFEHKVSRDEVFQNIQGTSELLCKEIAKKIVEVNGGPPSALFLAGGGSKLARLRDGLADALGMDMNRVAVAGNYFQISAFSEEYDLNNPEYATPLGIAISSGLNMINDSFRVILNGKPAKLFRSGSFTALNLLMMNGYSFRDIMGRSGQSIAVTVNGQRQVFYGTAASPASLGINGREGKLSEIIHAGDSIDFVPAESGKPAHAFLGDIEGAITCEEIRLNGMYAFLETPLKNGDVIEMKFSGKDKGEKEEKAGGSTEAESRKRAEDLKANEGDKPEQAESAAPVVRETPVLETAAAGRGKTGERNAKPQEESSEKAEDEPNVRRTGTEPRKGTDSEAGEKAQLPAGAEPGERVPLEEKAELESRGEPGNGMPFGKRAEFEPSTESGNGMLLGQGAAFEQRAESGERASYGKHVEFEPSGEPGERVPNGKRTEFEPSAESGNGMLLGQGAAFGQRAETEIRSQTGQRPGAISQLETVWEPQPVKQPESSETVHGTVHGAARLNQPEMAMESRFIQSFESVGQPEPSAQVYRPEPERQLRTALESGPVKEPEAVKQLPPMYEPKMVQEPGRVFRSMSLSESEGAYGSEAVPQPEPVRKLLFYLNGAPLRLPCKKDGQPYYLMDMIEYSGIDLKNPAGTVKLTVNGMMGMFQQELRERDAIEIRVEER